MTDFRNAFKNFRAYEQLSSKLAFLTQPPLGDQVLKEIRDFGPNPGHLRMFTFVPKTAADNSPLVVVLHGCGQSAAGYEHGAGWSTLAERYGFSLLLPEQQRQNNSSGCFNWFQPEDTKRGSGEAASIRQMIDTMVRANNIDPRRIFVTGLSAGGAMTSVMLACYPDVFAAGAIVAGLPYGTATNVQQALESMYQCPIRPAQYWGKMVRSAYPGYQGPWPRVSVWHGDADKTVVPINAGEIIKQWTSVHQLPFAPTLEEMVDGYPRQAWIGSEGGELIESYVITQMAHGAPLATGTADFQCGAAGPFLLEAGISSSYHIARFFGLVAPSTRPIPIPEQAELSPINGAPLQTPVQHGALLSQSVASVKGLRQSPARFDVGAVITKALEAAGLMKTR